MNKWTPKTTLIVAGVAVAGLWYLKRQAGETLADVGNAVNPVNQDNIFNRYFVDSYQKITGSQGTPGGDFYDWMHGG